MSVTCVHVQIWAKGAKPSNAGESDIECKESSWGVGANITTKLMNPAGEVGYYYCVLLWLIINVFVLSTCKLLIMSSFICKTVNFRFWATFWDHSGSIYILLLKLTKSLWMVDFLIITENWTFQLFRSRNYQRESLSAVLNMVAHWPKILGWKGVPTNQCVRKLNAFIFRTVLVYW